MVDVRVYVPATGSLLRQLLADGSCGEPRVTAFGVTRGLREWYVDDDEEALEYAASAEAARASLRLLDVDPTAARRRVVLAVDAPDAVVEVRDDLDRGVVRIPGPVRLADVASIHADDADAEPTVAAAASVIDAADLGDRAAEDRVDDAEGFELGWWATQELAELVREL